MEKPVRETKWSGTFQWWDTYPPGDIKVLSKEDLGNEYESTYTHMYNYIREKNWTRESKKWKSPDGSRSFNKILDAYNYQKVFVEQLNGE